jgi:AcrR family transcriptional regulator
MPKVSEAHKAERREQILDAARTCFARLGFHRTTMKDIVRESGLSPGAIYGYFASKQEIVESIAGDRHRRERERIDAARAKAGARARLHELASSFIGSLRDRGERRDRRVAIQIWSEALHDPTLLHIVRRGVAGPRAAIGAVVRDGQAAGEVDPSLDADAVARLTIALFQGFVLQQAWEPSADVDAYLRVIDRVLAGLARR